MGKSTRPSVGRLREILRRQDPPGFGPQYQPAIRASREEAPSRSRPAWVWWQRAGRYLSTLSSVERSILMVCLYNDQLWDIHDQRMLPALPQQHPLSGHPKAESLILPHMRGTVEIAESLGVLPLHPTIRVPAQNGPRRVDTVPFPWIGDFLLFLEDAQGPYCVNITVKGHAGEFEESGAGAMKDSAQRRQAREKAFARHAVEEVLYADAGIRTMRLTQADFDPALIINLTQLCLWHHRKTTFNAGQQQTILDNFRAALGQGIPPLDVIGLLAARFHWSAYSLKTALFQAIWQRDLRVDLFAPIFLDRPLLPERRDVLAVYSTWFRRS